MGLFKKTPAATSAAAAAVNTNTSTCNWDEIMCPYCFGKFSHEDVCFRFDIDEDEIDQKIKELEEKRKNALKNSKDEEAQSLLKAATQLKQEKNGFEGTNDDLKNYWIKKGWDKTALSELYEVRDGYTQYNYGNTEQGVPVADIKGRIVHSGKYIPLTDESGFVIKARIGQAESKKRLCPHCRNRLPSDYGKYPVKIISVVGATGSGKTVMLSGFLKNLTRIMDKVGRSAIFSQYSTVHAFIKQYELKQGGKALEGSKLRIQPPVFWTHQNSHCNEYITIVLYDIAGENCVDTEKMELLGEFIEKSNGTIMLIAPEQIDSLGIPFENPNEPMPEPIAVLSAMQEVFLRNRVGANRGSLNTPIAVTLSKSDKLRNRADIYGNQILYDNSNIYRDYSSDYLTSRKFNKRAFDDVNGEIYNFMQTYCSEVKGLLESTFNRNSIGCCAVAAIGYDIRRNADGTGGNMEENLNQKRIEEPFLWVMYKLGLIDAEDPMNENRGRNPFGGRFGR